MLGAGRLAIMPVAAISIYKVLDIALQSTGIIRNRYVWTKIKPSERDMLTSATDTWTASSGKRRPLSFPTLKANTDPSPQTRTSLCS